MAKRELRFSARRLRTAPCRGRRVEWHDQRSGIVGLHFRPHRLRWRCAFNASQESVGNAGSIEESTTDNPPVIDSVDRCEGGPGIIKSEEVVWRGKEKSVSSA